MWKNWSFLKRVGLPALRWVGQGMPLLLLLGLAFLLIALWWLGPQLIWRDHHPLESLAARVLATVVLLMLPLLVWALRLQRRNRRLEAERQQDVQRAQDPCLRYVHAQERALDRSLAMLRANLEGRNALYRLPWYLVLGQENTGKTSLINRSNQSFSLTGEVKAGSGRLLDDPDLAYPVDWWMGNEAVLIDPPGEFVSQPQDAEMAWDDDAAHGGEPEFDRSRPVPGESTGGYLPAGTHARLWSHLIGWLARNRSRRPLNGVVLMVDLVSLLGLPASDRKALAILLRSRLAELCRQLGMRPPLYVVLSKFDRLEGFEVFFARLPKAVREDIFGFTFTLDSVHDYDAWLAELGQRYDEFLKHLNEQVFDALSAALALEEREALFCLIRQLAGMRQLLLGFLADVLGSDRYATPALPRGVYFSSVYQQGLLCNAFVGNAAQTYGIAPSIADAQPGGRAMVYFARQLFQSVIYPEAGLASDNLKVIAAKRRALALSTSVAALGSLLVVAGWYHYYTVNRDRTAMVLERSGGFGAHVIDGGADPTGRNLLAPLNQIRSAVLVFGDYRESWPLVSDMGLYPGRQIGPKVDEAYMSLLSQRFLPQVAGGVMAAMESPQAGSDAQLAALRVYRMIEERPSRRSPIVQEWMAKQWQSAFPGENEVQLALQGHLDYAMAHVDTDLPQYRTRVAQVQNKLRQIPMPQRVYMSMRGEAGQVLRTPLDLRSEIGPAFDIVYQTSSAAEEHGLPPANGRIDALLTAKGYLRYFEPNSKGMADLAIIDQWALGERRNIDYSQADRDALADRIRAIYHRDYIDTWQRNLNRLEVRDFEDINQAVNVLGSVTGPAAPLRRLLETVRDNTEGLVAAGDDKSEAVTGALVAATAPQAGNIVRSFAPLTGLLAAKGDKAAYLDETLQLIVSVQEQLKGVHDSPNRGKAALGVVLDRLALKGPDPIGNLRRAAAGLPQPLNRQVGKLADESAQVLMIEALTELERRWDAEVYRFYNERLAGRYPFSPGSRQEVSLDDFAAFFGPQGKLQQFKAQYLKVFLEDNLEALYSERLGGYLLRTDLLTQLQAADRIRDAFFGSRGSLGIQFSVEPLGLTTTRRSSVLNIEGQLIGYSHGATAPTALIWPNALSGASGGGESRITLVGGEGNSSGVAYRGPWSMFRLFSQAQLNGASETSVDLSFLASDGGMRYRVTADKRENPFTQQLFRGFALPRTLLMDNSMPRRKQVGSSTTAPAGAAARG
ncbi:type VI secretion system membrane subunit TssM [Azoarcus indigens]|uniref:Type VI secretion system protein ImpL n=1 Tax=Azoarcus indigens TaxID=29545 RepID=A0A4R6DSG1_9RHOO|nr:type VI secretion system membrane subunit TssM [Azoarcus indigens]NMG67091.1 type VI secretion system membrane subunit TssM [Azoarcus indigens]TDN47258.1 type VI secretion system protein ImpL [Azoarcus indigens]